MSSSPTGSTEAADAPTAPPADPPAAPPPPDTLPGGVAGFVLLLALALLLLTAFPGSRPIRNPDETRDAEIAREFAAGDWTLLPLLNGRPYHAKPPLFFQATGLVFRVGGATDATARVAAALFGALAVAATWLLGERLLGRGGGLLAGAVLLGTPWFFLRMRNCTTDAALTAWVAVAAALLVEAHGRRSAALALAGGVAAGLAALSKQVHGLLFPFLVVGAWLLLRRDREGARSMRFGLALAAGVAVAGSWILVLAGAPGAEPGMSALQSFLAETMDRRFGPQAHHAEPPWYYLILIPRAAPWVLAALPLAAWAALRGGEERRTLLLPTLWLLLLLGALSLASGKRDTYLLPLLPAVALLVAGAAGGEGWGSLPARVTRRLLGSVPGLRGAPRRGGLAASLALAAATLAWDVLVEGPAEAAESGRPLALRAATVAGRQPLVLFRTGKGDVGQFLFPLERTLPVAWNTAQLREILGDGPAVLLAETGDVEKALSEGRLAAADVARWRAVEDGRAANTAYTLWAIPPR